MKEIAGDASGVTYDTNEYTVTVTISDGGSGTLSATISGDSTTGDDLDFTNSYISRPALSFRPSASR